jgi:cytochrome b/biopolymer transport protein ExbD
VIGGLHLLTAWGLLQVQVAFASFDSKSVGTPMSDINMVPLIDVMLVLLVLFIVTAPLLTQAVKLDLPKATSRLNDLRPQKIDIAVDASGTLFWNDEAVSRAELLQRMGAAGGQPVQPELHLRADQNVAYRFVAQTLADASKEVFFHPKTLQVVTAPQQPSAMAATVRVWDPLVRLSHWGLVAAVAVSWLGTSALAGAHQPAGNLALAIVGLRVLWGALGSEYARFSQFVRGPRTTWAYLVALRQRREPRHIGHNPLGAWMILALVARVAGLALTGWLYTTDRFWGDASVELVHRVLAWWLLLLVALHVAGVLFTGRHQRESLVRAMFSGLKRRPADDRADA